MTATYDEGMEERDGERLWPGLVIAPIAAAVSWLVLSAGLPASLKDTKPFVAAAVSFGNETTKIALTRAREPRNQPGTPLPPADRATIDASRNLAVAVLKRDPLNIEAFRQLARSAQQAGEPDKSRIYFDEAYRRSFRELDVTAQLFTADIQKMNLPGALRYADAMLRTRIDLLAALAPVMSAIIDQPEAWPTFVELMKAQPPWRPHFLQEHGRTTKNDDSFIALAAELRETPAALSQYDQRSFLYNLVQRGKIDDALSLWYASLPQKALDKAGFVYNGNFEGPVNDAPFNWNISSPPGALVRIQNIPGEGDNKGLSVDFLDRRVDFKHVEQYVALPPGKYKLSGRFKADDFQNIRGMIWRVYCTWPALKQIGETQRLLNTSLAWQNYETAFEVPTENCAVQQIRFELGARNPVEQLAAGSVWIDDVAIENVP